MAKKALVIDDEQIVLDSISRILAGEGFAVDVTQSGCRGTEMALSSPYSIVLTDIRMPDVGGMKVLRDIKRSKPSLPVIMITGYATVKSSVQAMKLGAADYLEKPFTPDGLLRAVETALANAETGTPDEQTLLHKEEIITVLQRAALDSDFITTLLYQGADALDGYQLTGPEKLALLTGDIEWIENSLGRLRPEQRRWLETRSDPHIW